MSRASREETSAGAGEQVLETERLRLRRMVEGDLAPLLTVLGDPQTMVHFPRPFDQAMVGALIAWAERSYAESGYGLYSVVLKTSGQVIGDCGFLLQEVGGAREVELAYDIGRRWWGRGYASEAAAGCIAYAAEDLGLIRLISLILLDNLQSCRVAEKNGLTVEGEADFKGLAHLVYGIALSR
jgi:RimJ/RimL family protein N-acetyltransferase